MTFYPDPILLKEIQEDEGRSATLYRDSRGLWTIGDGILVDHRVPGAGLRPEEMDFITSNRIGLAAQEAFALLGAPAWDLMGSVRRRVVINMAFNLGEDGLAKFFRMINALKCGAYETASEEMENSEWFKEVGTRGPRRVKQMRTGVDQL